MTSESKSLNLLHLSDIHFQEPYCLNLDTDPHNPIRLALRNDLRNLVQTIGNIDAILVTGDIAYKGLREEYQTASEWFSELCEVCGCKPTSIYTVPGNHDVDRKIASEPRVLSARANIKTRQNIHAKDIELRATFNDENVGKDLFEPMSDYNNFAAAYSCDISRTAPFWKSDLQLSEDWRLRMHGLTTTFFSGPGKDGKGDLYLGDIQRSFGNEDGIVRLVLMHHPIDWLEDGDELEDALTENASLGLFGHKHTHRYSASDSLIKFAAGAVNPNPAENNWKPGYNVICLKVIKATPYDLLNVETHQRVWQENPDKFVAKIIGDSDTFAVKQLQLRRSGKIVAVGVKSIEVAAEVNSSEIVEQTQTTAEAQMPAEEYVQLMNVREIIFHFWELSPSKRRKVMQALDLLLSEDDVLSEPERYKRAFVRAQEKGVLEKLKDAITEFS